MLWGKPCTLLTHTIFDSVPKAQRTICTRSLCFARQWSLEVDGSWLHTNNGISSIPESDASFITQD